MRIMITIFSDSVLGNTANDTAHRPYRKQTALRFLLYVPTFDKSENCLGPNKQLGGYFNIFFFCPPLFLLFTWVNTYFSEK